MGHGTRNANRAAGIADNKELIGKVVERVKVLETTTKDDGPIDKRFRMHGHEIVRNAASIETSDATIGLVEERLRLLERPLWKKMLRRELEPLDFEKDVLPEIERQCGPMPDELEEAEKMVASANHGFAVPKEFIEAMKESGMVKEEEKKEAEPPATPSHRQVVVDRKVPGPGQKKGEPDGTKAESRDN